MKKTSYAAVAALTRFSPADKDDEWIKNADNTATRERTGFTIQFEPETVVIEIEKTKGETFLRHWRNLFES